MEIQYDSDTSDDTRDLVERGLAINRRKYVSRADYRADERGPAPNRDMDISSVRLPLVSGTLQEEPSTRGLSLTGAENVLGQILNNFVKLKIHQNVEIDLVQGGCPFHARKHLACTI